jgi:PIN domain nuclease of toxin-antitoxin system
VAGELLDTHILIRWLSDPGRLSKQQSRILTELERRSQPVQISAMTLIELGQMFRAGALRLPIDPRKILRLIELPGRFHVLPITVAVAEEFGVLFPILRDPADTAIAATARVHGLRLMTSDDRIIGANVVSTIS